MTAMQGRIAVVTGASSGIGRSTAKLLAQQGAQVVLVALPGAELAEAADECRQYGGRVLTATADVGDSADVAAAFDRAAELGPVSAVFNNAGISIVAPVIEMSDDDWLRQLRTNLSGSFYVAREAARRMRPHRYGSIVNTGSELALLGQGGYVGYTATKGGILAMTRALAAELAVHGVRVNSVSPGAIDTPLLKAEFAASPDPAAELLENEQSIALGRIGQPTDIAAAVAFLLSDQAAYITGTNLLVDGGRTSCFAVGSIARTV